MRLELRGGTIDLDTGDVDRVDGTSVRLTDTERRLLAWMAERPERDLRRDEMLAEVWGYRPGTKTRALDTAIKVLRRGPQGRSARRAIVQEARLGALLHHPNVVTVHALTDVAGAWVVAMELVRGASLSQLARAGPLSPQAVIEAGLQVCAGLEHIHGLAVDGVPAGLIHRDVKPANLLLDPVSYTHLTLPTTPY